jgi:hypothetical protein
MLFEEVKDFLSSFKKEERFVVLGILYDKGIIEQREYSIQEIAYLTGYTREYVHSYLKRILNKLNKSINKEIYYE